MEQMCAINIRLGCYDGTGYEDRMRRAAMARKKAWLQEHFKII